jgi:hypothetical protein
MPPGAPLEGLAKILAEVSAAMGLNPMNPG